MKLTFQKERQMCKQAVPSRVTHTGTAASYKEGTGRLLQEPAAKWRDVSGKSRKCHVPREGSLLSQN